MIFVSDTSRAVRIRAGEEFVMIGH